MGLCFSKSADSPPAKSGESAEAYKVIVVGDGGVGKSAITIQFIQGRFEEEYDPTIEDTYQKFIDVDRRKVCLNVVDTAGQEDYLAMRDSWLRMGDGFILVFSLLDSNSFAEVKTLKDQIFEAKESEDIPMVIVGNKKDMPDRRQVSPQEASAFAQSVGAPFIETSAKTAENVENVFVAIVKECRKRRKS